MTEPEVLAFDLYGTLVDPIGVQTLLSKWVGPEAARDLATGWRQRQLEYTFRLTAMGSYRDFRWVTERALDDSLAALTLSLNDSERVESIEEYDRLRPFPDTESGLAALREAGHRMVVLSNGTSAMVTACLTNSGLASYVEQVLSVEEVEVFKPSATVYQHAADRLGRPIGEVRLISSNPFDIIGAGAAGMRTAWIDRSDRTFDTVGDPPELQVASLDELAAVLAAGARS